MLLAKDYTFSDWNNWRRRRHLCKFRSSPSLRFYQNRCLKRLLDHHDKCLAGILESIPEPRSQDGVRFTTSGTTGVPKSYFFGREHHELIDNHHIWRIQDAHNIRNGNVVVVEIRNRLTADAPTLRGPSKHSSFGLDNDTWHLTYSAQDGCKDFWRTWLTEVRNLEPVFVYMAPSDLQIIHELSPTRIECPVILTGETLYDSVRTAGKEMFTTVIDKMRCWDGGLSFFECPCGRKHIYDELCYVEQVDGRLVSTDFYNFAHAFIRYANGDEGKIEQGLCECGIYGNFLARFAGKEVERLITRSGKAFSGTLLVNRIAGVMSAWQLPFRYSIHQEPNLDLKVEVGRALSPEQVFELGQVLSYAINEDETPYNCYIDGQLVAGGSERRHNISFNFTPLIKGCQRKKQLMVTSAARPW